MSTLCAAQRQDKSNPVKQARLSGWTLLCRNQDQIIITATCWCDDVAGAMACLTSLHLVHLVLKYDLGIVILYKKINNNKKNNALEKKKKDKAKQSIYGLPSRWHKGNHGPGSSVMTKRQASFPGSLMTAWKHQGRSHRGPERPHCSAVIPEPLPRPAGDERHHGPPKRQRTHTLTLSLSLFYMTTLHILPEQLPVAISNWWFFFIFNLSSYLHICFSDDLLHHLNHSSKSSGFILRINLVKSL